MEGRGKGAAQLHSRRSLASVNAAAAEIGFFAEKGPTERRNGETGEVAEQQEGRRKVGSGESNFRPRQTAVKIEPGKDLRTHQEAPMNEILDIKKSTEVVLIN